MKASTVEVIRALLDNRNPGALQGWGWEAKVFAMCELIEREQPELVVDLGTFGGRTAIPPALQLRDNGHGILLTCDPWTRAAALEGEHKKEDSEWWQRVDLETVMFKFMPFVSRLGLVDICLPIRATAQTLSRIVADGSVDILSFDQNHSELASMRDAQAWLPKVRKGGYFIADDLDWKSNQKCISWLDSQCTTLFDINTKGVGWCRFYRTG